MHCVGCLNMCTCFLFNGSIKGVHHVFQAIFSANYEYQTSMPPDPPATFCCCFRWRNSGSCCQLSVCEHVAPRGCFPECLRREKPGKKRMSSGQPNHRPPWWIIWAWHFFPRYAMGFKNTLLTWHSELMADEWLLEKDVKNWLPFYWVHHWIIIVSLHLEQWNVSPLPFLHVDAIHQPYTKIKKNASAWCPPTNKGWKHNFKILAVLLTFLA